MKEANAKYAMDPQAVAKAVAYAIEQSDWSAPIEVVRPLVWLLSLEDGQDGKAPEARGDRREATSGGRADLTGPERGRYNPRARCEFGDVLPVAA